MSVSLLVISTLIVLQPSVEETATLWMEYYSQENILRFAEHLYKEKDYLRAAGEYQRYIFLSDQRTDTILHKIGLCYQSAGEPRKAIKFFEQLTEKFPQGDLVMSAHLQINHSYFLMREYEHSIEYLKAALPGARDESEHCMMRFTMGLGRLMQKNWAVAASIFDSLASSSDPTCKTMSFRFKRYAEEGKHLPFKNALLAGLFSGFVPGAGKVYCGRWSEGLFSFLIIGTNGYLAYSAIREENTARSWIYGGLTGFFYLGNIYGSYVSARVHNHKLEGDLITKIQIEVDLYHAK